MTKHVLVPLLRSQNSQAHLIPCQRRYCLAVLSSLYLSKGYEILVYELIRRHKKIYNV